jgi:hypothetical protein
VNLISNFSEMAGTSNKSLVPDTDSDDSMDWSDNLGGLKELYGADGRSPGADQSASTEEGAQGDTPPLQPPPLPPLPQQTVGGGRLETGEAKQATTPVGQPLEGPAGVEGVVQQPHEGLAAPPSSEEVAATGGGAGMAERARAYVEKKQEEAALNLRKDLGDKQLAYEAVLAVRKRDLGTKHLLRDGEMVAMPEVGSMVSNADRRLLRTTLEVSVGQRRAMSTSFDPQRLTCHCSGPHNGFKIAGGGGYRAGREAFLLTDQSYPPMLEASGIRRCLKFVRIEHGMLIELADTLVNMMRGKYVAAGSIVLLFSASNLAVAGTSGYCADMMGAIERLRNGLGEHMVYTPLPHFFGSGCGDSMTIRSAVEVCAWVTRFFGKDSTFLKESFNVANIILEESGLGGFQPEVAGRHRLPAEGRTYTTWYSSGLDSLPTAVRPANKQREERMLTAIIQEIRKGLAIDLEPTPSFERGVGPAMAVQCSSKILVMGSRDARRTKLALEEGGADTIMMHERSLLITKDTIEELAVCLGKEVKRSRPAVVVLHILEDTVYKALTEEGVKIPHRRMGDVMHFDGDLVLCDKQEMMKLLKLCKPLFEAAAGAKIVMVGPLPRYVAASCCSETSHMPNQKEDTFLHNLLSELGMVNKCIKDFLFLEGYRNARVMDPWIGLRHLDIKEVWGDDPRYIKPDLYKHLADGVKITMGKIGGKNRRDSFGSPGAKRGRADTGGDSSGSGRRPDNSGGGASGGGAGEKKRRADGNGGGPGSSRRR